MQVDSVGSQSDAAASSLPVPATPAQVPGIVAVVGDPLQFGGQPNGGQVLIPGFQNAAAQPNGVVPFISQPGGGGPSAAEQVMSPRPGILCGCVWPGIKDESMIHLQMQLRTLNAMRP